MASKEIVILVKARNDASRTLKQIKMQLGGIAGLKFGGLLGGLAKIGQIAKIAAIGGVATLVGGLALLAKTSLDTAADFEQGMANAAAIMERPIDSMQAFRDLALETAINPNFRVTALEATGAIEMLARNGVDATDILNGMLESTVLLSNSVGTDLSTAADIMTDAMNIFGIEAENASSAVDQMTGVVNNSKFTIDDYFLALGRAGASLAPLGGSFDDFNTSLALIAPFFNSGQRAGTSLANFFNRLIPTTNKARDAMLSLGMASTDENGEGFFNNFINRDPDKGPVGQIKSMVDVIEVLQTSLGGLTAEAQQKAILEIFGRDAQGAVAALLQFGHTFQDVQDSIMNTDALEAAATRMATLQGATDVLRGFMEVLRITIGDALLPVVTFLALELQGLVGIIIDKINPALSRFKEISVAFFDGAERGTTILSKLRRGFANVSREVGGIDDEALREFLVKLRKIEEVLSSDISSGSKFFASLNLLIPPELMNKMVTFVGKIVLLGASLKTWFASDIGQKVLGFFEFLVTRLAILAGLTGAASVLTAIGTAIAAMFGPLGIVAALLSILVLAWKNNWGEIQDKTAAAVEAIKKSWGKLGTWWKQNGPEINEAFNVFGATVTSNVNNRILPGLKTIAESVKLFLGGDTTGAVKKFVAGISKIGEAFFGEDGIGEGGLTLLETLFDVTGVDAVWTDTIEPALEDLKQRMITWVTDGSLGEFAANFSPMAILGDSLQGLFELAVPEGTDASVAGANFAAYLIDALNSIDTKPILEALWGAMIIAWEEVVAPNAESFVTTWLDKIGEWDFVPWAAEFMAGFVGEIFTQMGTELEGTTAESIWTPWAEAFQRILDGDSVKSIGGAILAAIINGWIEKFLLIDRLLLKFFTAVLTWVKEADWFTIGYVLGEGIFKGLKWTLWLGPTLLIMLYEFLGVFVAWFLEQDWAANGTAIGQGIIDALRFILIDGPNMWEMLGTFATTVKNWFFSDDRPWITSGDKVGTSIGEGIINGLNNIWSAVIAAVSGLASGVVAALKSVLGIASPSKVTMELGVETGKGFAQGISQAQGMVNSASVRMGAGVVNPTTSGFSQAAGSVAGGGGSSRAIDITQTLTIEDNVTRLTELVEEIALRTTREVLAREGRTVTVKRRSGVR